MLNSIAAAIVSILIFIFNIFSPYVIPDVKTEFEEYTGAIEEYPLPDTVYVLDPSTFPDGSYRNTAVALQGLVAKKSPQIFIRSSSLDNTYLTALSDCGCEISYHDEDGRLWTLEKLIVKFEQYITDSGYVLYRGGEEYEGLNIATNYATLCGWLPVPTELEDMVTALGLTKMKDISEDEYNVLYQWKFFEENKDEFNPSAVCHQAATASGLRDLAIQQGFYVFYVDEDKDGELFRKRVLRYFGDNTVVLGWGKYEKNFVEKSSSCGNMVVPSDHCHNNSILASIPCERPQQQAVKDTYTDPEKHYCAIVMSDGDNIQWIQNGYREYFTKLSSGNDFPMTWSVSPYLYDLSPVSAKLVYDAAGENNYFMAGVSGAGYINPTVYPKYALAGYTDITASLMYQSDLEYVQILDNTPENAFSEARLINTLKYYSRYDNIKGGVLSLDPARYEGGKGKVYFVDDKPFISYRLSLWHPSSEMSQVTTQWLDEQAQTVNSYPADIYSVNGYSVINVHPWSISPESLEYFVSRLDDDVVLVTVDELMEMMSENVPHENILIPE